MNSNDTSPSAGGALLRWVLRYGVAAVAVTATFTARVAMTAWVGPGLPTYVTFYPAVIVVAILVGCGPGLVATALVALTTAYWLLPPEGFAVDSPTDRLGLAMFAALGVLISVIAERYRRSRQRAATFERAIALRESVEAIRAAAQREQLLADVIENAGQAFGVVYPDGRFGLVNRAFEELTGYTGDELRAVAWAEVLTPPEWRAFEQQKLAELRRTGQPVRYEKEYLRRDGTRVPIELLVYVAKDPAGDLDCYSCFITDISGRMRAQERLRQVNAELAHRVAALEAANAEVRASRKAALNLMDDAHEARQRVEALNAQLLREADERTCAEEEVRASLGEKEVLLKEIHHRVKNNMQVISSLVALQAERLPDAAMRAVFQDVTNRVRSMALVHETLYGSADLARVEFAEYARSLLNYLWRAHAAAASGVRLALDLEPVPISVNAAVPCGLILNELVSNALKHAFRGRAGGEVAVSLRGGLAGQVCLRVRDNGAGLPAGFDWRQTDSLGLHLVQMLAGQLHATVEVSRDEGTEFAVMFGAPKL